MKTLLTLALLAALHTCMAQTQTIDGFGGLRLGKPLQDVLTMLNLTGAKTLTNGQQNFVNLSDDEAVILRYDSSKEITTYDYNVKTCLNLVQVKVPEYEVAGIKVSRITLNFYKDTLYEIDINAPSTEFDDAFKAKYGEGKLTYKADTIKCSSAYQGSFKVVEKNYTTNWASGNKNVKVERYVSDYRNSKCEEQFFSIFMIYNTATYKKVDTVEKQTEQQAEAKKAKKLKSKLDAF